MEDKGLNLTDTILESNDNRRNFLKTTAVVLAGLAGVAGLSKNAFAVSINNAAKAVLPNGKLVDRGAILKSLNLDPSTGPDMWLAIINCGSNASALLAKDARVLLQKGVIKENMILDTKKLNMIRKMK